MPDHKCPKQTCERRVSDDMFACRPHWFSLPKPIRDDIWRAFKAGDTDAHFAAMLEARRILDTI